MLARTCDPSYAQQRIWNMTKHQALTLTYNVHSALHLRGPLDVTALQRAFGEIVRRNESLRTVFREVDGRLRQVILPSIDISLHRSFVSQSNLDNSVRTRLAEEVNEPFSLQNGPLVRIGLITVAEDEHVLLLTLHHIAYDGWSGIVLYRELATLYDSYSHGVEPALPQPYQYETYASQHNKWLVSEAAEKELQYWRRQLNGASPVLDIVPVKQYIEEDPCHETKYLFDLPDHIGRTVLEVSRAYKITPHMLLLAAFKILLHRYTGQEDICVASSVAGRRKVEWESMIGLVRNAVVVRTPVRSEDSCESLFGRIRTSTAEAYDHQGLPVQEVLSSVAGSAASLWRDRLLWFNSGGHFLPSLAGVDVTRVRAEPRCSGRYLCVSMFPFDDSVGKRPTQWCGEVEYNRRFIERPTVKLMISNFEMVLRQLCTEPRMTVAEVGAAIPLQP